MWLFKYDKTSETVTDEFAAEVTEQLKSKKKSEFLIIEGEILMPISAIKLLIKLDERIASDGDWEKSRPPMPTSEKDGKMYVFSSTSYKG